MGLTYVDSGLYIAYYRAVPPTRDRARALLDDRRLPRVSSWLVRLEILPKPTYHQRGDQLALYERLLAESAQYVGVDEAVVEQGLGLACTYGLDGADAVHLACALAAGCTEFWTTERAASTLFRAQGVSGLTIRTILE